MMEILVNTSYVHTRVNGSCGLRAAVKSAVPGI